MPSRRLLCWTRRGEHSSIALYGEFDFATKHQLADALRLVPFSHDLTLDLLDATYIDASILGVLAGHAAARQETNAAPLRILNPRPHVRRLFEICRMERVFDMTDPRETMPY